MGHLFSKLTQIDFSGAFNKIDHSFVGEILFSGGFQCLMSSSPNDSSSTISFAVLTHKPTHTKMTEVVFFCFCFPFSHGISSGPMALKALSKLTNSNMSPNFLLKTFFYLSLSISIKGNDILLFILDRSSVVILDSSGRISDLS